ncbi:YafY family transcriptional regulator [Aliifodinibius sp. S!AR15-10]|uniref:helix-turn-helix transcriptional regulator n=1 Tax=Aliifodinibius sp. S!AR15-10 TaxID=2950437 RepID=UPI002863501A|nr:YafY family transcriptional regulator [Aliifodinibius sp. S!AR15-10]
MKLILMLQQSNKRLTVNDIAEEFNVSRRTVFRDFNSLSEMNVPVTWDKYKGYGIMRGYKIPPLMFTSKELATIMVGLNFVKSQVDQTMVEDAKGVELKIKEVLPDDLKKFMESLENRTVVDPFLNYGPEKKEGGNWYLVSTAASENKQLEFSYRSKSTGEITERKIDPYLLVFYRDHWNVIGWSHKRDDFRNFMLDRMSDIKISDQKFDRKPDIDVEGLIFRFDGESHLIRVDVSDSALRRFKSNLPTKIIRQKEIKPNLFRIEFEFDNLDFINKWLLQFSTEIKVHGPEDLIEKRNDILKKMMDEIK